MGCLTWGIVRLFTSEFPLSYRMVDCTARHWLTCSCLVCCVSSHTKRRRWITECWIQVCLHLQDSCVLCFVFYYCGGGAYTTDIATMDLAFYLKVPHTQRLISPQDWQLFVTLSSYTKCIGVIPVQLANYAKQNGCLLLKTVVCDAQFVALVLT